MLQSRNHRFIEHTHTHHFYISLPTSFKHFTTFCRILLLLLVNNCSSFKALGRLLYELGSLLERKGQIMIFIYYLSNVTFMTDSFAFSNTFKPPSVNWQIVVCGSKNWAKCYGIIKWKFKKKKIKTKGCFIHSIVSKGYTSFSTTVYQR